MWTTLQQGFDEVFTFELLLRRMLRWELMAQEGRSWLVNNNLFDLIDDRVRSDRQAGVFGGQASELSYLSLSELINLIFRDFWRPIFYDIFGGSVGYRNTMLKLVVPLRNKVAHFRPIAKTDLFNARDVQEMYECLRSYYTHPSQTPFYLPSDPGDESVWIDESGEAGEAVRYLDSVGLTRVWSTMGEYESIRPLGLSYGLGCFSGHIFIEIYPRSKVSILKLNDLLTKHTDIFSMFTLSANKFYAFISINAGEEHVSKGIRSIRRVLHQGQDSEEERIELSNLGSEYFVGLGTKPMVNFAF